MAQVKVTIEEHLVREVLVEVPDDVLDASERMMFAESQVKKDIEEEKIILTTDDWNGVRLFSAEDTETGDLTDWHV